VDARNGLQPTSTHPLIGETPRRELRGLPCVGRDVELATVEQLWRDADAGGRVAVIVGGPGIGKSRFLDAAAARLAGIGARPVATRCSGAPYDAIRDLVAGITALLTDGDQRPGDAALAARGREVLAALDGRFEAVAAEAAPGTTWELRRAALFERAAAFVADASRRRALVLVIDDLHLADGATRALLTHLLGTRFGLPALDGARGDRGAGLILVGTRPTAQLDDGWLAGVDATRIALEPLGAEGVRAFLQTPEVVAFFAEATGGRPAALEALLESRLPPADDLLAARLAALPTDARALLEALAVLGRPESVEALAELSGVASEALARALDALVEARLVHRHVVDGALRLQTSRPAVDEAARARVAPATRQALEVRAGRMLLARAADAPVDALVAAAEHLLRGGAGEEAVDVAVAAGERLEITFGYDRAIDLYRRAIAVTAREELVAALEVRLAELERLVGDFDAALAHAESSRRRNPDAAAHRRVAEVLVARDEIELALDALADAEARCGSDTDERGLVRAARAEALFLGGKLAESAVEAQAVLQLAADSAASRDRAIQVRNTLGKVALADGQYARAAALFDENVDEARALGRAFEECRALFNSGIARLRMGDAVEAQARYQAALRVADAAGDHRNRAYCLQNLGVLAHWRNDYATALSTFQEAVSAFKTIGQRARLAWLALDLASVFLDLNEVDRAEAMVRLALEFGGARPPAAILVDRDLLAGRVAARRGRVEDAVRLLDAAAQGAEAAADRERAVDAALHLVRAHVAAGDVASAAAQVVRLRAVPLGSQRTRARALLVEGELLHRNHRDDEARRLGLESAELFRRVGDLEGEWRAQFLLGRTAAAQGDRAEATRRYQSATALDRRVRERVPPEHRAAHADDPDRVALERALGIPRVVPFPAPTATPTPTAAERPRLVAVPSSLPPAPSSPVDELAARYPRLVGRHPRLRQVLTLIDKVAPSESLVLIHGESGTGKELIADAIHAHSPRRDRPFVKVNCGALVETLLLSELFGHERGAFTGALQRKKGRFEAADGGTIFLDEIGDISPKTQVALLRVLQEREFERVGGTTPVKIDVRILCATHRNLEEMVARGEFREDLYYRLKGIQIELPSLRERLDDLPLLADAFLESAARERNAAPKRLSDDAIALLRRHAWPGNVRELENVIRSVSLFADGAVIEAADLTAYTEVFARIAATQSAPSVTVINSLAPAAPASDNAPGAIEAIDAHDATPAAFRRLSAEGLSLKELKTRIEIECITEALTRAGGNITRAADLLGMKRPRLSQLIKEHGLSVEPGASATTTFSRMTKVDDDDLS